MAFCLDTYLQQSDDYEILASQAGFKDCAMIIRFKADEVINVKPGEEILGVRIIGVPPIPIGIKNDEHKVLIPYTKPCHGTSVVELPIDEEEIEKIKKLAWFIMFSTVVGSFPVEMEEPTSFKDKLLNVFNLYDPYKIAIKNAVYKQLDAGIDVVSDGQVRGDMVTAFTRYIPGMKLEGTQTVINGKIRRPSKEITTSDLRYAKSLINKYYDGDIPDKKGIKGIITGPSTIVYSSRISHFYRNKNDAVLDLADSLKYEAMAIEKKVNPKYIQIDEPFLSTGLVDLDNAKEAIDIISERVDVPVSMHVCGTLDNVFKDLTRFNIDILDCEFAGNDVNLDVLKENVNLLKNKKLGFGCIDSSVNEVDSFEDVKNLVGEAISIVGKDNLILDPDCGLRKTSPDVAFEKLKLITKAEKEFL